MTPASTQRDCDVMATDCEAGQKGNDEKTAKENREGDLEGHRGEDAVCVFSKHHG